MASAQGGRAPQARGAAPGRGASATVRDEIQRGIQAVTTAMREHPGGPHALCAGARRC
jgi:hypothetical protein